MNQTNFWIFLSYINEKLRQFIETDSERFQEQIKKRAEIIAETKRLRQLKKDYDEKIDHMESHLRNNL